MQQLEQKQDFRQIAVLLSELDLYLMSFPGRVGVPKYVQNSRDDDDSDDDTDLTFIEASRTPDEVVDIEQYVLQCMILKVVKLEPVTPAWPRPIKSE